MRLSTQTPTGNPFLKGVMTETALTHNGAVTNPTTLNPVLDLFFVAGAARNMSKEEITALVSSAYNADPMFTLRLLFWARDVRGGAGERRFFRVAMHYLISTHPELMLKFWELIPTYGRWDDMWLTENMGDYITQLQPVAFHIAKLISTLDFSDLNNMLLCKWLPRKWRLAAAITKELKWTHKQYRKFLVANTKVVEHFMSANGWEDIDLSKVPSKAFNKYKKAFERHTPIAYKEFIDEVINWTKTLNAKALFPHEIVKQIIVSGTNNQTLIAQWKNLAKYSGKGSIMPVVDVSGSMSSTIDPSSNTRAIHVSTALGIYLSEAIDGPFKDHIISFSGRPNLHKLSGNIIDKNRQVLHSGEDMSTNFVGVFECILKVAKRDNLRQEDMPEFFIILSDMEFNYCGGNTTNYKRIKQLYDEAGYEMPNIVFWNLLGRMNNYPVQWDTPNTMLLSGYSPALMKSVLSGSLNPIEAMLNTINNPRYNLVSETFSEAI